MVAGGVYPDLVFSGEASGIFISSGAVIPLDDLIDKYGENIKKIYRPKELELTAMQYGQTYLIPTNRPSVEPLYPAAGYYLAYDVLKDAGFPVVKTLSQYSELI
jgi:putative aldouronate transport system substrate-binding protein